DRGQQFLAITEMPVRRRRADAGHPRGIGEGETGRTLFGDQAECRLQQRLFQIAVMVAALGAARFLAPAHVKGFYMSRPKTLRFLNRRSLVLTRFLHANRKATSLENALAVHKD